MRHVHTSPATIAALVGLERDPASAGRRMSRAHKQEIAQRVGRRAPISFSAIEHEIGRALIGALQIDPISVFLRGWAQFREVQRAASPMSGPPEMVHSVRLAEHTLKSEHRPSIQLLYEGTPIVELGVNVTLAIDFDGAVLKIKRGKVRALEAGSYQVHGTIDYRGSRIWSVEGRRFRLPGRIVLPRAFPIPQARRA